MIIVGVKLPKWSSRLLDIVIEDASSFIENKYNVDREIFADVKLQCSTTCRFAKYMGHRKKIRLNLNSRRVYLYDMKSLGDYVTSFKSGVQVSLTCQLIHELTHFIQFIEKRKASEVETTKNEIEYLKSIGINVYNYSEFMEY